MPTNASFEAFNLPPLDRPRAKGAGELAYRLKKIAKFVLGLMAQTGRWSARAVSSVGNDMPAGGDFSSYEADDIPELARMAGETQWGRATERLVTGNRQADDARRAHFSATDQLDAASYELRMLMKELAPVVEAGLPVAATAEVVRIEAQQPAKAPAEAPAVVSEKRAKPRKKTRAAAA